jgi:hypothetical protein
MIQSYYENKVSFFWQSYLSLSERFLLVVLSSAIHCVIIPASVGKTEPCCSKGRNGLSPIPAAFASLTLPLVAPPLPDVDSLSLKRTGLVVVCPLAHHC